MVYLMLKREAIDPRISADYEVSFGVHSWHYPYCDVMDALSEGKRLKDPRKVTGRVRQLKD